MTWQIAALSSEVREAPFAVKIGNQDYVLFRDEARRCHALADRCAHRRAPLSLGKVTPDGLVECPYHGWRYEGATGACRVVPNFSASESVPRAYKVQSFKVAEARGWIMIADASAPTAPPASPALEDGPEGRLLMAYPAAHVIDTLLDSPSALLDLGALSVMDDHRYGDPIAQEGLLVAHYAVCPTRLMKRAGAMGDFPFVLSIKAPIHTEGWVSIELRDLANELHGSLHISVAERDARLSSILWRQGFGSSAVALHAAPKAHRIAEANAYVSTLRQRARQQLMD